MTPRILHLAHHDVTLVAVSRGTWWDIERFQTRMEWKFKWVSSYGSDFNYDFHVSFTKEQIAKGGVYYNYEQLEDSTGCEELPGFSVFYKNAAGEIFHTYSGYARAGDILIGTYNYLDHTPKGRNERRTMDWVRHHDSYERQSDGLRSHSEPVSSAATAPIH